MSFAGREQPLSGRGTVAFTPAINWWGFLSAYLHSIQIIFSGFPAHPQHAPISTPANSVYLFRHRTFCPILSRRAGGCSVAFRAILLCPHVTGASRIVGGHHKGRCKCCAENYSTRSRRLEIEPEQGISVLRQLPTELQRHMCGGEKEAKPRRYRNGVLRA